MDRDHDGALDGVHQCVIEQPTTQEVWVSTDSGYYKIEREYTVWKSPKRVIDREEGIWKTPFDTLANVNCVLETGEQIWIGTEDQGVKVYASGSKGWQAQVLDTATAVIEAPVRSLYQSRDGVIWIGTRGNGIFAASALKPQFDHYFHRGEIPESQTRILWAILPHTRQPDRVWLGTDGDGLVDYDLTRRMEPRYLSIGLPGEKKDPASQIVRCMVKQEAYLWVGTRGGLYRYHPEHEIWDQPFTWPDSPSPPAVLSLWLDSVTQKLWVGTEKQGLFILDPASQTLERGLDPQNSPTLGDFTIAFIGPGVEPVTVLIGSSYGFFEFSTAELRPVSQSNGDTLHLPGVYIRSVLFHKEGDAQLWVGTNMQGLIRYDRRTREARRFDLEDGLPNKVVYGMVLDGAGNIWLSTNVGITRFDREKEIFINYGKPDGLQDYEFNTGAYAMFQDSLLYFGGVNGFNRVRLTPKQPPVKVPIALEALIGYPNREERRFLFAGDSLNLPGQYEYVKFRLAALEYHDPAKHHFSYRIRRAGEEAPWKNLITRSDFTLGKKGYGAWLVEFRASDSFGAAWHPGSIRLEIERPAWLQWWVILPTIILLLAGLFFAQREFKRRRTLAQQEKAHAENLDFLRKIGSQLTFPAHREALVERLKEKIREMVGESIFKSDLFLLGLPEEGGEGLSFEVLTEYDPVEVGRAELIRMVEQVAHEHYHLSVETRTQLLDPKKTGRETTWVLTRPLVLNEGYENEKRLGITAIVSREAEPYTENDRQIFGALGDYLAIALDNSHKINAEYSHEMARSLQQALRSSLTEHFTKNLLAKAQGFVFSEDKKALLSFLSRMGKLIEITMRHSEKGWVTLKEEVEYLRLYLELQQANMGPDRLQFSFIGADDPEFQSLLLPSMVVQTYVENAILHGVAGLPPDQTGKVKVTWKKGEDRFWCVIEDNGGGFTESSERENKKRSHGMKLTRERLNLLGQLNDFDMTPQVGFVQDIPPRGTRVTLTFPLEVVVELKQSKTQKQKKNAES